MHLLTHELEHIRELQLRIALYEDLKAYQALYELLSVRLKHFCFSFVKSNEAADEIVSDVFIKLWEIRNKLPDIHNLRVYLYTVARNFCINYITRQFKHPVVSLDEIDIEPMVSIGNPEELCVSSDMVQKIRQAIRRLPPRSRIIFQMVKEDGMRYKEVAEVLGLSPITVRNQLAIAIHKLAEALPVQLGVKEMKREK